MEWITHSHFKCKKIYYCALGLPKCIFPWETQGRSRIHGKEIREFCDQRIRKCWTYPVQTVLLNKKKHQNENFHWHHSFSLKYSIINTDILFSLLCVLNGIRQAGFSHLLPLYHFKQLTWWQKELFAYCLQVSWYSVSKFPSTLSVNIECIKHTINRRDYFVLLL